MKNYTYYLYFEHRCSSGRPRTDEMCVFYHKEGGECLHSMIYSSLDVDMDQFYETKQWHKDEEEIKGSIDGPHSETNRWMCHVQFILLKAFPFFQFHSQSLRTSPFLGRAPTLWICPGKLYPSRSSEVSCPTIGSAVLKSTQSKKMKVQCSVFTMIMLQKDLVCEAEEKKHTSPLSVIDVFTIGTTCLHGCAAISMFLVCFCFFSPVCYNVSASVTEHRLVNLTPGSKYNISLAAVTGAGEGPQVIRIINTLPENMTGNNLKRVRLLSVNTQDLNTTFSSTPNIPFFSSTQCCCGSWVCCLWCF